MDIMKDQALVAFGELQIQFQQNKKKIYSASEKNVRASREATQRPREMLRL